MKSVQIGPLTVGDGQRPLVVAEAGINHNGHLDVALQLVKAAKAAGADVIKFQTHLAAQEMLPDRDVSKDAGSHVTRSLYDIMTECHLTKDDHLALQKAAADEGLLFMSTPFSIEAVDLLEEIGMPVYKVGSGEITNIPYLKYVAAKGKPMILSTGTAGWEEVEAAVAAVRDDVPGLVLMQCTSNYPTPYDEVNLGVLDRMRDAFDVPVGLSDHTQSNYTCFGAVAKGACLIEKHFTLSRELPGIDQPSSLEPHELRDLVQGVAAIHAARGSEKRVNEEAMKVRQGFGQSIVTIAPVRAGEAFAEHVNVWVKRPGSGIPSRRLGEVIGRNATRNLPADYMLTAADIEGLSAGEAAE